MNSKFFFAGALGALVGLASCTGSKNENEFNLTYNADGTEGQEWVLIEAFSNDTIAAGTFGEQAVINGTVDAPSLATLQVGGNDVCVLALEPGNITVSGDTVSGTAMNDVFAELKNKLGAEDADAYALTTEFVAGNVDNPYSTMLFFNVYPALTVAQVDSLAANFEDFGKEESVQQIRAALQQAENTAVGKQYIDFEADGVKLSDYVTPGNYSIIDFWAPWCPPCRAEMPGLQELYTKYHDKGLNVVGVDVWQREGVPARELILKMGITYPIIYDAPREVTEQYGILAIPAILVVDPEGKIVARNIYGEELAEFVDNLYK